MILILTRGNDSPILVYYVLVTFSGLEELKHQKLSLNTQHWRAHQNKQKPYGATLSALFCRYCKKRFYVSLIISLHSRKILIINESGLSTSHNNRYVGNSQEAVN